MKYPIYQTEMLWDVQLGIYKRTTYYSDGSSFDDYIPKGPVILPEKLWFSRFNTPDEFPEYKTVNCFHPKVASFVVKMLNWLSNVRFK